MRAIFGNRMLHNHMLKSTAISDAGVTKQTLYEVERSQFTRGTYDRAMESLNAVNSRDRRPAKSDLGEEIMARKNLIEVSSADEAPAPHDGHQADRWLCRAGGSQCSHRRHHQNAW